MPAIARSSASPGPAPSRPAPRRPPQRPRPAARVRTPRGKAAAAAPAAAPRALDDLDLPDELPGPRRPIGAAERAAFETAALPYQRELLGAALRLTRSRSDAEDLVQETLLRALAAWPSFIPGSNCRAWLHRILTNSFISGYRRRRRHNRFASETGEDATRALYGASLERAADPKALVGAHALGDEVVAALAELADDYRTVVELADLQGIRYREIADRLGVPIGTVMSRLFRARRQLEARLAPYAADHGITRAA
jgi:RNA polymerase sigma-70 factor, ECF subfamily